MIDIEIYDEKKNCYGCQACKNICPQNAVTMQADKEGFYYPSVDQMLCTNCGSCRSICPIRNKNVIKENYEQNIYAVKHAEEEVRRASSSGGMFTVLSDYVLEQYGVVYGVVLDDIGKVSHIRAITKETRDLMRGSKYVQSDMEEVYHLIKADLAADKIVLFTGTPCQTEGLTGYLKGLNTDKLLLCDIVCHGVPSQLMWQEYIHFVHKKHKIKLRKHYFRVKDMGWHTMCSKNVYMDGREDYKSPLSQLHMKLFLTELMLRPCCYECRFSSFQRCSDITIADFWGIDQSKPEFDDNKGVSLVIINTNKGADVFAKVKAKLIYQTSDKDSCLQRNLVKPAPLPAKREEFWRDYQEQGYDYIVQKYVDYTNKTIVKQYIINILRKVKKIILSFAEKI